MRHLGYNVIHSVVTSISPYGTCFSALFSATYIREYASYTACIKMIGAVWKLIIFTSMVNRIINTSSNERIILQVYDTCLKMFDMCTLGHTAHIEAIVQFLPHSDQHVRCDGPALFPLQRHPVV